MGMNVPLNVDTDHADFRFGCDARKLFKIDHCLIPFGVIIRLLKRRQFIDEPDAKKQRFVSGVIS